MNTAKRLAKFLLSALVALAGLVLTILFRAAVLLLCLFKPSAGVFLLLVANRKSKSRRSTGRL